MELFRSSGLPEDEFKGEVMEGWDLSNSDLRSLDLTGTVLVNCKIEGTIFPDSFDPATQIRKADNTPKTRNIPDDFQPM